MSTREVQVVEISVHGKPWLPYCTDCGTKENAENQAEKWNCRVEDSEFRVVRYVPATGEPKKEE